MRGTETFSSSEKFCFRTEISCLSAIAAHTKPCRKEFEEKYPKWAEVAYEENLSDVGTWMETLRNTSFNNMRTLQKLQDAVEELYKEAEEEEAMSTGQNGRTNED
uniref:Uncharacterized protein n=1 Tax=Rhodosorus marinus TaxID=101924 RepID=A0A7S3E7J1_9RHOD|mmetsp:Transcript_15257/g.62309  ORF Transcript_15257/g.62309 Transcript_15257/m.62309 type:complete len:105 (+) Transcript_15257:1135-1449(+)